MFLNKWAKNILLHQIYGEVNLVIAVAQLFILEIMYVSNIAWSSPFEVWIYYLAMVNSRLLSFLAIKTKK